MVPLFFGRSEDPRFGMYRPGVAPVRDTAVVLCNPWGEAAIFAHRALRQLAVRLSANGHHVLRFDYGGTGDSAGDGTEVSLDGWRADIREAHDELRDTSGARNVAWVGLGLGASLVLSASSPRQRPAISVLWDPVMRGASYLELLRREHLALLRSDFGNPQYQPADHDEALGHPLPPLLRQDLEALDLCTLEMSPEAEMLLLTSPIDSVDAAALADHLRRGGADVAHERLAADTAWHRDEALAGAPIAAIEAIVNYLAERT